MKRLIVCATIILKANQLFAADPLTSLDASLTGWTTEGTVSSFNSNQHLNFNTLSNEPFSYDVAPVSGYMAQIQPIGSSMTLDNVANALGVNLSSITSLNDSSGGNLNPTNFGFMTKSVSLSAGTTYKFYWTYISTDYTPYADGAFFSLSNGTSVKQFNMLARTAGTDTAVSIGTSAYPTGVRVLASYGATPWIYQNFTVSSSGIYTLSFGTFNAGDTAWDPYFFVSDLEGTLSGALAKLQPSSEDTQLSIQQTATYLKSVYASQNAVMNNALNYDCNIFDVRNLCMQVGAAYTRTNGNNDVERGYSSVVVAYRPKENIRIGGYIEEAINNKSSSQTHLSNKTPILGAFVVWNQNGSQEGLQLKASIGYGRKDLSISRDVFDTSYSPSEAGQGNTKLNNFASSLVASYMIPIKDRFQATPYLGLRYTQIKADGYTEASSDTVTTPLSYSNIKESTTSALVGVKGQAALTDKAFATAQLGLEQDFDTQKGNIVATGLNGLTSVTFNDNPNRTRASASLGGFYNIDKRQRLSANFIWTESPFQSKNITSTLFNYTIGF